MAPETIAAPDLLPMREARPVHARWSELNGEFLDFAAEHPEYLDRDTFASVCGAHWLRSLHVQPWPLFLGTEQRREVERVTLGMDRLVKAVVERFLGNDPARIVEFYRARYMSERFLSITLEEPNGIRSAPSRGDYAEGREGLKCLEFNAGGRLGGLQAGEMGEAYLACPPVARFLEAKGRRARAPDPLGALFRHLLDETARLGVWTEGEFNVAVVNRPNGEAEIALGTGEMFDRAFQRVLEERGMTGRAFACSTEDFGEARGALVAAGHPVHLVLQQHDNRGKLRFPYLMSKMGCVNFISGPISYILSDKRNLALISEHARSDEFTREERALIEQHLPWTRTVRAARTVYRGRGMRLPDDLVRHREAMVLKKGSSLGGIDVVVGRFRTEADWRADVARAAKEGDWIAQEYVEAIPYCFPADGGAVRHDLVWGLFACGDHFGGAFLRMMPHGGAAGVVNANHGAAVGVCLELED